jgi:hypothetical protein
MAVVWVSLAHIASAQNQAVVQFKSQPQSIQQFAFPDSIFLSPDISLGSTDELDFYVSITTSMGVDQESSNQKALYVEQLFNRQNQQSIVKFVLEALKDKSVYRNLAFSNNVEVRFNRQKQPALIGWQFGENPVPEYILINLSKEHYQMDLSEISSLSAHYDQMSLTPFRKGLPEVAQNHGFCRSWLNLDPHTITRIYATPDEMAEYLASFESIEKSQQDFKKLFYLPVSKSLIIEGESPEQQVESISIFDRQGRHIKSYGKKNISFDLTQISVDNLELGYGLYSVRIMTQAGEVNKTLEVSN